MTSVANDTPHLLSSDRQSFEDAVSQSFNVDELNVAYKAISMKRTLSKDERKSRKSVINQRIEELEKQNHITKEGSNPSDSIQETKPKLLDDAPIAVVLFAGGGGVECGMVAAGIRPVISVELDPDREELSDRIIEVHERNFGEYGTKVIRKTVQQVAAEGFDGFPRNPDYLHSSNVCKNFSNAKGTKKGEKEQPEDIECAAAVAIAIKELQPKNFTLEQVPGFKDSQSFKIILEALANEGYTSKWDIVNFADYGLPQARQRLVLRAGKDVLIPLPPLENERVGWYEAIKDIIPDMEESELVDGQKEALKDVESFGKHILIDRVGARTEYRHRFQDQPCLTLLRSIFTDGKGSNRNRFYDIVLPDGSSKNLSIHGAARLQGFPDWYQFPKEAAIAGTIIGNSVPPLFAFKLFSQVPQEKPQDKGAIALICYETEEQQKKYCIPGKWEWCGAIALDEYEAMSLGEKIQWAKEKINWIESAYPFGKSLAVIGDEDFVKRFDCLDIKKYPRIEIESDSSEVVTQKEEETEISEPLVTQYLKSSSELAEIEANEVEEDSSVKVEDGKTYLLIDAIALDEETQSREVISPATIDEYTRDRLDGAVFPAVVVFFDGEAYYLGDGFHRTLALKGAGDDYIHADIRQGTKRDAKLHSCGANSHHGLRRTSADKRKSVITLLNDEEWVQWSNREIARRCGVDEGMVRKYRAELSAGNPQTEVKFERGGKTHTQKIRETFPRQVLISPDHPTKPGKEVTITAKLEDGSYLVEGEATQPKYIVEIPKAPKPITSVHQEEKAIAVANGLRTKGASLLPECDRNDGIEPEEGLQKVLKNQAAINQLVDCMSAITHAQSMQLINALRLDLLSGEELKALLSKVDSQLNKISAPVQA
jgi:DNA (cytosine-5)-methyltransferase 1